MRIDIDVSGKKARQLFKSELVKYVNGKGKVSLASHDKVIFEIQEPYTFGEEWLVEKSKIKKRVYEFISNFRINQYLIVE